MAFTTAVDECELRHDDRWLGFYDSIYFQVVVWIFAFWWTVLSLWAAYNLGRVVKGWWLRRKVGGKVVVAFTYGCLLPACVLRVLYMGRFLHTSFTDRVILCDSEGFPWFVVIRNIFYSLLLIVFSGLCLFWVALDGLIANTTRDSEGFGRRSSVVDVWIRSNLVQIFWVASTLFLLLWVGIDLVSALVVDSIHHYELQAVQFGLFGIVCVLESLSILRYGWSLLRSTTLSHETSFSSLASVNRKKRRKSKMMRMKLMVVICSVAFLIMGIMAILTTFASRIPTGKHSSLDDHELWNLIVEPVLYLLELVLVSAIIYTIRAPDPRRRSIRVMGNRLQAYLRRTIRRDSPGLAPKRSFMDAVNSGSHSLNRTSSGRPLSATRGGWDGSSSASITFPDLVAAGQDGETASVRTENSFTSGPKVKTLARSQTAPTLSQNSQCDAESVENVGPAAFHDKSFAHHHRNSSAPLTDRASDDSSPYRVSEDFDNQDSYGRSGSHSRGARESSFSALDIFATIPDPQRPFSLRMSPGQTPLPTMNHRRSNSDGNIQVNLSPEEPRDRKLPMFSRFFHSQRAPQRDATAGGDVRDVEMAQVDSPPPSPPPCDDELPPPPPEAPNSPSAAEWPGLTLQTALYPIDEEAHSYTSSPVASSRTPRAASASFAETPRGASGSFVEFV